MMKKLEIKEIINIGLPPIAANVLRFFIYFSLLFIVVSLLYKESADVLFFDFFFPYSGAPDIFRTVIFCSLMFLIFTTIASAITATREQNHFKTSFVIRLLLFVMNVLPISLFQHVLFPKFGFRIIYFVVVYFFVQVVMDLLKSHLSFIIRKIKIPVWLSIIIHEILAVVFSVLIVRLLPFSCSVKIRELDMSNVSDLFGFFVYIVLFNAVTFFTVEYCINVFWEEYRKNYTKYYFLYCHNIFQRILFVLKNAMPQILEKIRKNLSWLVMFIIAVEGIFEKEGSLGFKFLLVGSTKPDGALMVRGMFHLLVVMFCINSLFDIILYFHKKNEKIEKENIIANKMRYIEKRRFNIKTVILGLPILAFTVFYVLLFVFNQNEYAFAGYYDFQENQKRTMGGFFQEHGINETRCDPDLLTKYKNEYLCVQEGIYPYFSVIQLGITQENGETISVIPYYDKEDSEFYLIKENVSGRGLFDIKLNDRIVSIERITKYESIALFNTMTSFSLFTDKSSTLGITKPLYLVVPYYIFYFMTILLVVVLIVYTIYMASTKHFFTGRRQVEIGFDDSIYIIGKNAIIKKMANEILYFINTINIIVIFMLVNLFLNKLKENGSLVAWENQSFAFTVLSYCFIQILIVIMFSNSFVNEIVIHVKRLRKTKEFYYYNLIGMRQERQYDIYNMKYGRNLFYKLLFQTILFVLNINWFVVYAFNTWRNFNDAIGITYAISFENVFTKIIRYESIKTDIYSFIILIVLNGVLFGAYYHFQKKLARA